MGNHTCVAGGNVIMDITAIRVGEINIDSSYGQTLDFRFVVVSGTSSTSKTSKQKNLKELKNAGVDINNYTQVMKYLESNY